MGQQDTAGLLDMFEKRIMSLELKIADLERVIEQMIADGMIEEEVQA
jgi:uncharacterized coiled-coil protein SlyX